MADRGAVALRADRLVDKPFIMFRTLVDLPAVAVAVPPAAAVAVASDP